jgi:superfamily II DNA helicase RecQ
MRIPNAAEVAEKAASARFMDESPFSMTAEVIENEGSRKPRFSTDVAEKSRDGLFSSLGGRMLIKMIAVPFDWENGRFDETELKEFTRHHRVLGQSNHIFDMNGRVYVALVLEFDDDAKSRSRAENPGDTQAPSNGGRATRREAAPVEVVEPKKKEAEPKKAYEPTNLNDAGRQVYERLRKWRLDRARDADIKPYLICTNRELEEIVLRRPKNLNDLGAIKGMSSAKLGQYGTALLTELRRAADAR